MTPGADPGPCPTRAQLEQVAAGVAADDAGLSAHLDGCPSCAGVVAATRADNALLAELVAANADRLEAGAPITPEAGGPDGYEIRSEIHRGSQGVVYEARQTATKRTVALKVILQGAFATRVGAGAFEREVELVASLRHPNIVTVFDSGLTADGRHFLAMERVDGVPLDAFLKTSAAAGADGAGPTPVAPTLALFARIGEAVAYAHRRGIIHRDLKPANILVDDAGEPHVLDFGLAKLVENEGAGAGPRELATVAGEFVGTFAYAAPEQVAGDPALVDTRTDVYALGVILYEMLTGHRPHALTGSVGQVVEKIAHGEPVPPRARRSDLDEDVERIVLEALAKDPVRRYQSVPALLDDVRRFLAGEPIHARRDDRWYVLGKTLRRYRPALAVAAAVFALLVAFAVAMWVQKQAASAARERAEREAWKLAETLGSYLELIGRTDQEDPDARAAVSSIPDLLDEATRIVAEDLADLPEIAAPIRASLGLAYLSQSQFAPAEAHLSAALAEQQRVHDGPHPAVAEALHNVARLHWKTGRYDEAEREYRLALEMRRALHGDEHVDVARTMHHLASTLRRQDRLEEAEGLYREALAQRRRLLGDDHPDVANSLNGLGACLHDAGRLEDAAAAFARALASILARTGENDWRVARARHSLASCLIDLGRLDEAEVHLTASMAINRRTRVADDPDVARGLHERARLDLARGDLADAETAVRRALEIREAFLPDDHPERAGALALLGRIRLARGDPDEAADLLTKALARGGVPARRSWRNAVIESALGACRAAQGRPEPAEALLAPAHARLEALLGPDAPATREAAKRLEELREGP